MADIVTARGLSGLAVVREKGSGLMFFVMLLELVDAIAWHAHRLRCLYCYDECHASSDNPSTCAKGFDLWLRARPKKIKTRPR